MAAAAAGRWEVVRKPGRRGTGGGGPAGRKALGEANGGRGLAPPAPLAASETLFELGFEKPAKKRNKEQVPPPPGRRQKQQQQQQQQHGLAKKPPAGDAGLKQGKFRTLEDALKALDLSDLQKELDKSLNMFPENPSVWVKDLAGYLNYKLQAPRSDPTLSPHPHDYPYCLVSKELRSLMKSLLSKAVGVLELFFDHCIYTMLQELDKTPGESLHGYRICIQAVMLDNPKVATANLNKYLELLRSHQNRPAKCLTIMWALGQAGFSDLTEGLKVWLSIMLPVLGIRSLAPYAVACLDRLLMGWNKARRILLSALGRTRSLSRFAASCCGWLWRMHPNLTKGFGLIGPKDFFPLLDFAFVPNNSLSPSLQEQLRQLYPRLKVLAFGARPETTLHACFPSFLSRTTPGCPAAMKQELLRCLTECLRLDPLSFSVWRQLYTKHLSQSSLLLNHFLETWDSTSRKVRRSLQETVHLFTVTNEELAAKGQHSAQDLAACRAACKSLLLKMKASRFPWSRLVLVLLVFTAGFLMHDIRTRGSFQASASAHVLRSSGVWSASQQAWSKVSHFSVKGYSWLEANVPLYYSHVTTVLGPNLQLVWATMKEAALSVSETCAVQLAWLTDSLPGLVEWLQTRLPDSALLLAESLKELLLFLLQTFLLPAVTYITASLEGIWELWVGSCHDGGSWDCARRQLASLASSSWTSIKDWALSIISRH